MSIESEVCAFIRGRKDKSHAMELAPTIFCISYTRIFEILQKAGLMDCDGNYIEPMRLTGKEPIMEKNAKYPSFRWSPERKLKLAVLYQEGVSPADIATQLGTTAETVYDGISKFNITCTRKAESTPSMPEAPSTTVEPPSPSPTLTMEELLEVRRLVNYTRSLVRDASKLFLGDRCYEAFMALGKQDILLQDAQQILRKVLPPASSQQEP